MYLPQQCPLLNAVSSPQFIVHPFTVDQGTCVFSYWSWALCLYNCWSLDVWQLCHMLPSPITFHNVNAFHCSTALKKHTSHLCRLSGYCQTHGNAHMHQDMACENMNIRIVLALKVVFLLGKKMWINILKQFTRGDPPEIPTHRENHVLLIRCISVS